QHLPMLAPVSASEGRARASDRARAVRRRARPRPRERAPSAPPGAGRRGLDTASSRAPEPALSAGGAGNARLPHALLVVVLERPDELLRQDRVHAAPPSIVLPGDPTGLLPRLPVRRNRYGRRNRLRGDYRFACNRSSGILW